MDPNFATENVIKEKKNVDVQYKTENIFFKHHARGFHDCLYHVCIISGLEYKFMVKSVDPDGTTAVIKNKKEPGDKEVEEGEEVNEYEDTLERNTSPDPAILPNRTGNNNNLHVIHRNK